MTRVLEDLKELKGQVEELITRCRAKNALLIVDERLATGTTPAHVEMVRETQFHEIGGITAGRVWETVGWMFPPDRRMDVVDMVNAIESAQKAALVFPDRIDLLSDPSSRRVRDTARVLGAATAMNVGNGIKKPNHVPVPTTPAMTTVRVFQALSDPRLKQRLRGKLPKAEAPDVPTVGHPSAILRHMPASYKDLGNLTEALVRPGADRRPVHDVALESVGVALPAQAMAAASSVRFMDSVARTRQKVVDLVGDQECAYNPEVAFEGCPIVGHPDIVTAEDVFEIKTTGRLKENWVMYLLQTFTHAALRPGVRRAHIVLPLQGHVWSYDLQNWTKRNLFLATLMSYEPPDAGAVASAHAFQEDMTTQHGIGKHVDKQKTMAATISTALQDGLKCMHVFLSKTAKVTVSNDDAAAAMQLVVSAAASVFAHAPYVINLSTAQKHDYVDDALAQHLRAAVACGFKGVVAHVGKACALPREEAVRERIDKALAHASPDYPLVLETPAGQGSELLTDMRDFMDFAASFEDPRLGVCVDTCHVFASGMLPSAYLAGVLEREEWRPLLKVVHFDDSSTAQGSRVDRHATPLGSGHIPREDLVTCAEMLRLAGVPMLQE